MTAETQAKLLRQTVGDRARAAVDTVKTVGQTVVAKTGRAARVGSVLALMAVGTSACDQVFAQGPSNPNQSQSSSSGDMITHSDKCNVLPVAETGPTGNTQEYDCTNWLPISKDPGKGTNDLVILTQVNPGEIDGSAQYGAHYDESAGTPLPFSGGVSAGTFKITKPGTTNVQDGTCLVHIQTAEVNGSLTTTAVSADCKVPANQFVP